MTRLITDINEQDSLPASEWILIDQSMINEFANATNDHQWIHIDAQRCEQESPFKTPIAHGYLTTTLMPGIFYQLFELPPGNAKLINYGVDNLRFLEPVRVNDHVRYQIKLIEKRTKASGLLFKFDCEVEIKGREKPAMVGTFIMLLIE